MLGREPFPQPVEVGQPLERCRGVCVTHGRHEVQPWRACVEPQPPLPLFVEYHLARIRLRALHARLPRRAGVGGRPTTSAAPGPRGTCRARIPAKPPLTCADKISWRWCRNRPRRFDVLVTSHERGVRTGVMNTEKNETTGRAGRREWIGLAVLAFPTLLLSLDMSALHLAVPHLAADLRPSSTQLLWIIDIYGFMVA